MVDPVIPSRSVIAPPITVAEIVYQQQFFPGEIDDPDDLARIAELTTALLPYVPDGPDNDDQQRFVRWIGEQIAYTVPAHASRNMTMAAGTIALRYGRDAADWLIESWDFGAV